MRKLRKRFPRGARQRVQHVRIARRGVGHVIEKRAELRVRQFGRDVGDFLDDRLAIERGGDHGADLAELLGVARVFAGRRQETRPLGDVAGDLRGADDLASLVSDRRDRERDRHSRAVLALSNRLVVVDLLAGANLGEDHVFFVLQFLGNQHANGLPDRLGCGVAEHTLGGRIPRHDDAVEILRDDGIVGRFDDRGETATGEAAESRSLMSRAIFDAPITRPASSRIGDTVSEIGMSVPSFRCRTVSKCVIAWPARMRAEHDVFFGLPVRRNDHANRLADDFGGGVAEHALRRSIP